MRAATAAQVQPLPHPPAAFQPAGPTFFPAGRSPRPPPFPRRSSPPAPTHPPTGCRLSGAGAADWERGEQGGRLERQGAACRRRGRHGEEGPGGGGRHCPTPTPLHPCKPATCHPQRRWPPTSPRPASVTPHPPNCSILNTSSPHGVARVNRQRYRRLQRGQPRRYPRRLGGPQAAAASQRQLPHRRGPPP